MYGIIAKPHWTSWLQTAGVEPTVCHVAMTKQHFGCELIPLIHLPTTMSESVAAAGAGIDSPFACLIFRHQIEEGVLDMNSQLKLGDGVNDCGSLGEWGHWQQTGSISHGGQTITESLAVRSESVTMKSMLALRSEDEDQILSSSQGNLEALDALFSRYRRTLLLVAYRVLGDHNQAEDAVQRCLQSAASRNVPLFDNEGAFRSWLVRVLIDVAVFILQEREWAARIHRTDQVRIYPIDPEFA
jgi:hypothetical protein